MIQSGQYLGTLSKLTLKSGAENPRPPLKFVIFNRKRCKFEKIFIISKNIRATFEDLMDMMEVITVFWQSQLAGGLHEVLTILMISHPSLPACHPVFPTLVVSEIVLAITFFLCQFMAADPLSFTLHKELCPYTQAILLRSNASMVNSFEHA